jgi:hypothetical protein
MDLPAQLLDAVKDNVVVQWCMVATVIVLLTSKVAAKLKGPIGAVARWAQGLGEKRVHQLVNLGVRPGDIPTPPPLRVPWRTERTDTRERQAINGHVQGPRTDETVVRASE